MPYAAGLNAVKIKTMCDGASQAAPTLKPSNQLSAVNLFCPGHEDRVQAIAGSS
jgi:hypothetical protein